MKRILVSPEHAERVTGVLPRRRTGRCSRVVSSGLVATALALSVVTVAPASAITRNSVLSRAQSWVDSPVRYSQRKRHLGYRTDCSGYVSMCWKTKTSWSTRSFKSVTRRIAVSQLKPGDAMLKKGYHIRLFYGWVDEAHTQYVAYEAGSSLVSVCRIHSIAEDLRVGYVPVRYRRVTDSPKSTNLLQNGSFNTWAAAWGRGNQPVWWQTDGPWWQTVATQRKDQYRSARSSLLLTNPGGDSRDEIELAQSVPIQAGAGYRLTAWAMTPSDPRVLELGLQFLDSAGKPVADTVAGGEQCGVGGSAFTSMSVLLTAPSEAVRALVTVRLAGSEPTTESGVTQPSSVTVDDMSLVRQ